MPYRIGLVAVCMTFSVAVLAKPIVVDLSPKNDCQLAVTPVIDGSIQETELVSEPQLSVYPTGDLAISKVYRSKTGLSVDLRTSPNHLVIASLSGGCIGVESGEQAIQALPPESQDASDGSVSVLRYSGTYCQFTSPTASQKQVRVKLELRCKPMTN